MSFIRPILNGFGAAASFARGVLPVRVLDVSRPTNRNPLATATIQFGDRFVEVGVSVVKRDPRYPNAWSFGSFGKQFMVFGNGDSALLRELYRGSRISHEMLHGGPVDRYPDGKL